MTMPWERGQTQQSDSKYVTQKVNYIGYLNTLWTETLNKKHPKNQNKTKNFLKKKKEIKLSNVAELEQREPRKINIRFGKWMS